MLTRASLRPPSGVNTQEHVAFAEAADAAAASLVEAIARRRDELLAASQRIARARCPMLEVRAGCRQH